MNSLLVRPATLAAIKLLKQNKTESILYFSGSFFNYGNTLYSTTYPVCINFNVFTLYLLIEFRAVFALSIILIILCFQVLYGVALNNGGKKTK